VLGVIIITTSAWHLYRHLCPFKTSMEKPTRRRAIAALMFPVGAEVGFSSSGAGALGTIVLLGLSSLTAAQVVGTDLAFGLCVTLAASGLHFALGNPDVALLIHLVIGGIAGGLAGSLIAPRVPNRQLRLGLSICLLALGVQFCYQAVVKQTHPYPSPRMPRQKHGSTKEMQARLRHVSITSTESIYVREIPEIVREARKATANIVLGLNEDKEELATQGSEASVPPLRMNIDAKAYSLAMNYDWQSARSPPTVPCGRPRSLPPDCFAFLRRSDSTIQREHKCQRDISSRGTDTSSNE
jgi:hypothetical protein